jgi:hypothetical protein
VTASELAYLALGLLLGIAAGAAMLMTVRSRPPTHEIRVTLARDAIPRRASTLATDVLHGVARGPAPGGPGDRRRVDRDAAGDRTRVHPEGLPVVASPVLPWLAAPPLVGEPEPTLTSAWEPTATRQGAIGIRPERDPAFAGLTSVAPRVSGAPAAPTATDELGSDPATELTPSLRNLLDGDHRTMLRLVEVIGGADESSRKAWDTLLSRFVDAVRDRSIDLGLVDLPMGNPFWDTFTIDQCRHIVVSLQATGRRFDGRSDWADGIVPTYRDLGRALAEAGVDPRRVRAWPNSLEIGELFRGARVAAAEAVEQWAPDLEAANLRAFLGDRDRGLDELWPLWDAVRMALGYGVPAAA